MAEKARDLLQRPSMGSLAAWLLEAVIKWKLHFQAWISGLSGPHQTMLDPNPQPHPVAVPQVAG